MFSKGAKLIFEDDTLKAYIEETEIGLLFHCYSLRWSASVMMHYHDFLTRLLSDLKYKGYDKLYAPIKDSELKLQKFASLFGFYETDRLIEGSDGIRRLWVCHHQ